MFGIIGNIISQGVKLGAIFTVAEAIAPKIKSSVNKVTPTVKRGIHHTAKCIADATDAGEPSHATESASA